MAEGGEEFFGVASLPRLGNRRLAGKSCAQRCLPDSALSKVRIKSLSSNIPITSALTVELYR